jgi:hypothetical protein
MHAYIVYYYTMVILFFGLNERNRLLYWLHLDTLHNLKNPFDLFGQFSVLLLGQQQIWTTG